MLEGISARFRPEINRVSEISTRALSGARTIVEPVSFALNRFHANQEGSVRIPHFPTYRVLFGAAGALALAGLVTSGAIMMMENGGNSVPTSKPQTGLIEPSPVQPTIGPTTESKPVVLPPTAEASPTSKPAPTETPAPKTGYEATGQGFVYRTEKGDILNVPHIEGLKAEMAAQPDGTKRVIYKAEKTNSYGLIEGEYAGFFHPNVSIVKEGVTDIKDRETDTRLSGGVALRPEVTGAMMKDALKQFENQTDRYISPIPIDISTLNANQEITLAQAKAVTPYGPYYFLAINSPSNLAIVHSFYGDQGIRMITASGRDAGVYPLGNWYLNADIIEPGKEMLYFLLRVSRDSKRGEQTIKSTKFGDRIVYENGDPLNTSNLKTLFATNWPLDVQGNWNVLLSLGALKETRPMDPSHILKIVNPDGSFTPVFLISSQSANKEASIPAKYKAGLDAQAQEYASKMVSEAVENMRKSS